jgi:hypothetical protein
MEMYVDEIDFDFDDVPLSAQTSAQQLRVEEGVMTLGSDWSESGPAPVTRHSVLASRGSPRSWSAKHQLGSVGPAPDASRDVMTQDFDLDWTILSNSRQRDQLYVSRMAWDKRTPTPAPQIATPPPPPPPVEPSPEPAAVAEDSSTDGDDFDDDAENFAQLWWPFELSVGRSVLAMLAVIGLGVGAFRSLADASERARDSSATIGYVVLLDTLAVQTVLTAVASAFRTMTSDEVAPRRTLFFATHLVPASSSVFVE